MFANIDSLLQQWNKYIVELQVLLVLLIVDSKQHMAAALTNLLKDIEKDEIECLRDQMVKDVGGELVFNEELIYEYIQKSSRNDRCRTETL